MSNKTKGLIGLSSSFCAPIQTHETGKHPTYGERLELGHAVKAYLAVQTSALEVPGDNALQIDDEIFVSGSMEEETTLSDLEKDAAIYGATLAEDGSVEDGDTDVLPEFGHGFVQELLKKNADGTKSHVFRATWLYRIHAVRANYKDEADTRKGNGNIEWKNAPVSWKILLDNAGKWRKRNEFATQSEAEAWLESMRTGTAAAAAAST